MQQTDPRDAQIAALHAENTRLREALRRVMLYADHERAVCDGPPCSCGWNEADDNARAALAAAPACLHECDTGAVSRAEDGRLSYVCKHCGQNIQTQYYFNASDSHAAKQEVGE